MTSLSEQKWLNDPACIAVMKVLSTHGGAARFVGGCVRDAVLGRPLRDIDIATTQRPETVMVLLEAAGIKAIPTGIEHGTITAVCRDKTFEITTLRSDVETDGRRAEVSFTQDWYEDAERRDFTFNAMSCDLEGRLYDPFNGVEDLKAGRVRFVGDAKKRIQEDYLRLLRFFRFSAFYGKGAVDTEAMKACRSLKEGLARLSGERIAQEFLRLLESPHPAKWVSLMKEEGILSYILPQSQESIVLEMLCAFEDKPDRLLRLAVLLPDDLESVIECGERLRLSNAQKKRLRLARAPQQRVSPTASENELRSFLFQFSGEVARDQLMIYWAEKGFSGLGPAEQNLLKLIEEWEIEPAIFPLTGRDLLDLGFTAGPEIGQALQQVQEWWCETGCRANKERCLDHLSLLQS